MQSQHSQIVCFCPHLIQPCSLWWLSNLSYPCGRVLILPVMLNTVLQHYTIPHPLLPSPLLSGLSLHLPSCRPLTCYSRQFSLPAFLSAFLAGWLLDSFYCLLSAGIPSEEHSCCGQAVCGRTRCRGEPRCCPIAPQACCVCAEGHSCVHMQTLNSPLPVKTKQLDTSGIINTKSEYLC